MNLVRNTDDEGIGKYVVIKMNKFPTRPKTVEQLSEAILQYPQAVEFGKIGSENEFFVLMLKDENAEKALIAYADNASKKDLEYSLQINALATRAGPKSPFCKTPD